MAIYFQTEEPFVPAANTAQHSSRDIVVGGFRRALQGVRAMLEAIYRSVFPTEEGAWLAEAQLELFRTSTRFSSLMLPIAGFLIAEACSDWVPRSTRLMWWLSLTAIAIVAQLVIEGVERIESKNVAYMRLRACTYVGLTIVVLCAWGSMSIFLWAPDVMVDHMFLILILACSLAGSIAISSAHPAVAATVFVMHAGFIIGPLTVSRLPLDTTLGGLAVIYVLLLSGQFYALNVSTAKFLRLKHERESLVEGLRVAKEGGDRDRARAASASRTRSQFLSNMNHELRTPMNAILGFSELIKNKSFGQAVDKYAEYAGIIHDSGQHLLGLIDDMLDLAKIENGRFGLRESEVSVAQLIGDAVQTSEETARASQISLSKSIGPGIPRIWVDERAVRQIIVNLLSNALKFTPTGGCVIAFARLERNGRVAFGVEDTGIGIDINDQTSVFERFGGSRHDVTTSDRGTGLGLAIVKGFTEAHDGEVKLESTLGAGTRVTVYLPVARAHAEQYRAAG